MWCARRRRGHPSGRDVQASTYVWVSGGEWGLDSSQGQAMQMTTDKKTYHAGETAKLMIVAGKPGNGGLRNRGRALDVRHRQLIRSQDSTVAFEVPVTANDEPGITVNASFVRNGTLYRRVKIRARVPPVEHELNVKIATDKAQYQPGQAAEYNIGEVTAADGKPAAARRIQLGRCG